MKYRDGSIVNLGDLVSVPFGSLESAKGRVVMLGEDYTHLTIETSFLEWVKKDRVLKNSDIVIEWVGINPFAHNEPQYAPVGNYMFCPLDEDVKPIKKDMDAK